MTAALLATVALTACGGSGDKAGGGDNDPRVVLTLESEDDLSLSGAPEFAAAVERLSGGSMRIAFVPAQRSLEVQFERGLRSGPASSAIPTTPASSTPSSVRPPSSLSITLR